MKIELNWHGLYSYYFKFYLRKKPEMNKPI